MVNDNNAETQIEKLKKAGLFGSTGDPMWNGKMHECCGSTRSYYHKDGCKLCVGEMKTPDKKKIDSLINDAGNEVRFTKTHRNSQIDDLVSAMYSMYVNGLEGEKCDLRCVAQVYRRTRQGVYSLFKSRGYKLRSKPKKESVFLDGRKFTQKADGEYWRETLGGRLALHTYIWEKHKGRVPYGWRIVHRDQNIDNNELSNLECVPLPVAMMRSRKPIKPMGQERKRIISKQRHDKNYIWNPERRRKILG